MEDLVVNINGKEYRVRVEESPDGKIRVYHDGETYEVEAKQDISKEIMNPSSKKSLIQHKGTISAPLPGTISEIKVKKGDKVKQGQAVIKLIAMKMENEITAPADGTVKEIKVKAKDSVEKGTELIIIG